MLKNAIIYALEFAEYSFLIIHLSIVINPIGKHEIKKALVLCTQIETGEYILT